MNKIRDMSKEAQERMPVFCRNLRNIVFARKLSIAELAKKSGVSEPTISQFVSGHREPKLATAYKVAVALEVTLDELCREVTE